MEVRHNTSQVSFNNSQVWKLIQLPYLSKIPKAYYTSEESMTHLCYFFSVLSIGAIGFSLCLLYTLETGEDDEQDESRRQLKNGGTVSPEKNYSVENDTTYSNNPGEIFTVQTAMSEMNTTKNLKKGSSSDYLTSLVWAMKIFIINIFYLMFIAILFWGIGSKYQFPATITWLVGTSVTAISNYVLNVVLLIKYFSKAEDGFGSRMSDKCINIAYMVIIVLLDVVFLWSGCTYLHYINLYPYPAKPIEKHYNMFYAASIN